jgi:hypothetical protein
MIDPSDKKLSIRKQDKLLEINRNRLTTRQTKTTEEDRKIMKIIDERSSQRSRDLSLPVAEARA